MASLICHNNLTLYFWSPKFLYYMAVMQPIACRYCESWCDIWPIRALSLRIRWTSPPTAHSSEWRRNARVWKRNWWKSCGQTISFYFLDHFTWPRGKRQASLWTQSGRTSQSVRGNTYLNFFLFCHGKKGARAPAFFCEVHMWYDVDFLYWLWNSAFPVKTLVINSSMA